MKEIATHRISITKEDKVHVSSVVNFPRYRFTKNLVSEEDFSSEDEGITENNKRKKVNGLIRRGATALQIGCLGGVLIDIYQDLANYQEGNFNNVLRTIGILVIALVASVVKQDVGRSELVAEQTSEALTYLKNSERNSFAFTYSLNYIK